MYKFARSVRLLARILSYIIISRARLAILLRSRILRISVAGIGFRTHFSGDKNEKNNIVFSHFS
ncbi:MAG: hypothetical protein JWQ10_898 [Herbaspirillum sp.]|nr:hypothetical protein [Herbaspirillum sp.]